jgi:predicted AAA+ superfamily ATPase
MFNRILTSQVKESLFKGLVIIIYGARQVGKTTMVKDILNDFNSEEVAYFDCDLTRYREAFGTQDEIVLKNLVAGKKLVVIDEAQRVENIGLTLKILHNYFPQTQFIATGSSSFELANQISEPLTGRSKIFTLYPLSTLELKKDYNLLDLQSHLQNILVYGLYPNVFDTDSNTAKDRLEALTGGYLYQDLLKLEEIKKPKLMDHLLRLLAFQVGSQVSFSELAQKLSVSTVTVQKYVDLLEKSFIVFSLPGFSRNLRNEINKSPKIYFYDLGIRNSLISNLNAIDLRDDIGALWENFCILERVKYLEYNQINPNRYFWRNYQNQEIDYIEEKAGVLNCYEFKFSDRKKVKLPKSFAEAYPKHTFEVANSQNWIDIII